MTSKQVQVGDRFGRLTVKELTRVPSGKYTRAGAKVICDCENVRVVQVQNLVSGNTTSCGCLHKEIARHSMETARNSVTFTRVRDGQVQTVTRTTQNHGQSQTPLYRQWKAMIRRCESPVAHNYKWYGGKGIKVCPEWRDDFLAFKAWAVAHGYTRGLELDRIDENGGYGPGNCRWLTKKANIRNRDLGWSDETDAKLIAAAQERGISPYELILSSERR
jgi:hypothetical protein